MHYLYVEKNFGILKNITSKIIKMKGNIHITNANDSQCDITTCDDLFFARQGNKEYYRVGQERNTFHLQ